MNLFYNIFNRSQSGYRWMILVEMQGYLLKYLIFVTRAHSMALPCHVLPWL